MDSSRHDTASSFTHGQAGICPLWPPPRFERESPSCRQACAFEGGSTTAPVSLLLKRAWTRSISLWMAAGATILLS